ncbi:hypothetical protein HY375_02330 [Candidatus Berkelbacteria bacterium]|nr:hypothetical protein [Candidatus Berkelbacteria bacterium]
MIPVVLRITRHGTESDRLAAFKAVFGPEEVTVVCEDVRYNGDPAGAIRTVIDRIELDGERKVVAIDPIAPLDLLQKIVDGRDRLGDVLILRAMHKRDPETGRVVVTGRDPQGRELLAFSHYEVLEQIVIRTRPL